MNTPLADALDRFRAARLVGRWAYLQLRYLRTEASRKTGLDVRLPASPRTGSLRGIRSLSFVLARGRATCLERSLIVQRFLADRGRSHDVVVGVQRNALGAFEAHAWLEGIDDETGIGFSEIRRRGA
jgi:hypothetical protein